MDGKIQDRHGNVNLEALQQLLFREGDGQVAGADLKSEAKDVLPLARGAVGLNVIQTPRNQGPGVVPAATGLNELDAPDSDAAKQRNLKDSVTFGGMLEQIIDLLLNENERTGVKTNEDRLKALVAKMKVDHALVLKNLQKSLAQAQEVAKMQNRMKAFSWIMAIFMVLVAVAALAATVVTGGSSLAIAAAAIGAVGSAVGVIQQGVQGAIQKDADKYADRKIKEYDEKNVKPEDRKSRSELIEEYTKKCSTAFTVISSVIAVAGLVVGAAAIRAAANAAKEVAAEAVKRATEMLKSQGGKVTEEAIKALAKSLEAEIAREFAGKQASWLRNLADKLVKSGLDKYVAYMSMGSQAGGIVTSGTGAVFNFKNASLQKELADWRARHMEAKKGQDRIEGELDDVKEALVKVLMLAQENASRLGEIIFTDAKTSDDILRHVAGAGQIA